MKFQETDFTGDMMHIFMVEEDVMHIIIISDKGSGDMMHISHG